MIFNQAQMTVALNISLMENKDTKCILSHVCMAVQNDADFCSCNASRESWKSNQHEVMYVPTHNVKKAWNSYTRKMIAAALDHGRRHPGCQECWDQEDAGMASTRTHFNSILSDLEPMESQPRVLIIKPGNTCNLACRMCNPATSSGWYSDSYKLENVDISFNEYTRQFETIRNSFNKNNDEFWGALKEWIPNLHYIDIYGGEPFLATGLFGLLEHGVKVGAARDVSLQLHTNATIWNPKYIEILSQYKNVKFHISMDSFDPKQNSYIRYPSDTEQVIENTLKFWDYLRQYDNVELGVTHTITSLNIYYVNETNEFLSKTFGEKVEENLVINSEYDIRHIPESVRKMLRKKIKSPGLQDFLGQIIPGCDIEWPRFCRVTDRLDEIRGQSFRETFPEWWEILEPHWVK